MSRTNPGKKSHKQSGNRSNTKSTASGFPSLRQFFSGYLHQDFADEYGSAVDAAKAFRADAAPADLKQLQLEWKTWRASLKDLSAAALASELRQLGAGWAPPSAQALDEVGTALG